LQTFSSQGLQRALTSVHTYAVGITATADTLVEMLAALTAALQVLLDVTHIVEQRGLVDLAQRAPMDVMRVHALLEQVRMLIELGWSAWPYVAFNGHVQTIDVLQAAAGSQWRIREPVVAVACPVKCKQTALVVLDLSGLQTLIRKLLLGTPGWCQHFHIREDLVLATVVPYLLDLVHIQATAYEAGSQPQPVWIVGLTETGTEKLLHAVSNAVEGSIDSSEEVLPF
jgi:hypothetical protein